MTSPVGRSGPSSPPPERGGSVSPCKLTLPGSGLTRTVSVVSTGEASTSSSASPSSLEASLEVSHSSSNSFLSGLSKVTSGLFRSHSAPATGAGRSLAGSVTIGAPPKRSTAASSLTYTSSAGAQKTLKISDLPSFGTKGPEYGARLEALFMDVGAKISIDLDPSVDVIANPENDSDDDPFPDAVKKLTNMWSAGSLEILDGHRIPSHDEFVAEFSGERSAAGGVKHKDKEAFVKRWVESLVRGGGSDLKRLIECINAAHTEKKDMEQLVNDLVRKAKLSVNGVSAPDLSTIPSEGNLRLNALKTWLEPIMAAIPEERMQPRVIRSLSQGTIMPVRNMANLLFNREFNLAGDPSFVEISPRTADHLTALATNQGVPANLEEWEQNSEKSFEVSVDTVSGKVEAKFYFNLKLDPSFKFEGTLTANLGSGGATVEIKRIP